MMALFKKQCQKNFETIMVHISDVVNAGMSEKKTQNKVVPSEGQGPTLTRKNEINMIKNATLRNKL
jgi:hypothetical protein